MLFRNTPRAVALALFLGALVFVIGHFSDLLLAAGHPRLAMIDDVLFAAVTVVGVLAYDHCRRRRIRDKLWLIGEMNHHVRNQLQIIQYSAYASGDRELFHRMQESVARIDWALREILGKTPEEGPNHMAKPSQSVPAPSQPAARTPRR